MTKFHLTDFFGIGNALQTASTIYFQTSRQTGRTTQLVHALKTGDRVIAHTSQEAQRIKKMAKERGVDIDCIVADPKETSALEKLGTSRERTFFEHTWVEMFYLYRLNEAKSELHTWTQRLSGFDERHLNMRRLAEQVQGPRFHWIYPEGFRQEEPHVSWNDAKPNPKSQP